MIRTIAAGATALALAAAAAAYAQQPPSGPDFGRRQPFGAEDRAAFLDARIAALHAGLKLTPEQEKAWPAFEQAYRDLAATRGDRSVGPRTEQSPDPAQRAQRDADALAARSTALKRYADAVAPLYQSLDDGQKRRFGILSRRERPRFREFSFWHGGDRGEFRSFR
ncbi:MAG TPA: Spy/CpxP family protein refolding chaperone [Xanthobacteraceae bacterium]|nr:Spy/CpxP family protein refolding chaperone [Xanthobacteraceae bacterium]